MSTSHVLKKGVGQRLDQGLKVTKEPKYQVAKLIHTHQVAHIRAPKGIAYQSNHLVPNTLVIPTIISI